MDAFYSFSSFALRASSLEPGLFWVQCNKMHMRNVRSAPCNRWTAPDHEYCTYFCLTVFFILDLFLVFLVTLFYDKYAIDGHMNGMVCAGRQMYGGTRTIAQYSARDAGHTASERARAMMIIVIIRVMHLLQNRRNERITQRTSILLTVAVIFLLSSWDY